MKQETKVGLFLIGAIASLLAGTIFLGGVNVFSRRAQYTVDFDDVQALPPKATVKVSGVEVGRVVKVFLVNQRARVVIAVDPELELYADATARIGSTGIIGTRFVELNPGSPDQAVLPPNSVIDGLDGGGMNEMMDRISGLFEDDGAHGDTMDNLKATIANIRSISAALDQAIGQRPKDIREIVTNMRDLTASARVFTEDLKEITQARKDDFKEALGRFRSITEKLDGVLTQIENGEGAIGVLISDKQTGEDVKEAVTSIKNTAKSAEKMLGWFTVMNSYWHFRQRYSSRDDEGRTDAGLAIYPRPGKFYAFGVTNIGEHMSDEKHTLYERRNRITIVMGADLGPFTGYAGAIRSRGGVGLNLRPLWKYKKWDRRFELTAEASDFDRERVVNGTNLDGAVLHLGGRLAVLKWCWVGARVEDVLERPDFMAYINFVVLDKDLANMLGFAGLAR